METIFEVEPVAQNKRNVWWRMVTVESNGLRHNLTTWAEDTRSRVAKRAKMEGCRIVEVQGE